MVNKKDGPFEEYYSNGNPKSKGTYKNGMLEGPFEEYHQNGNPLVNRTYKNGVLIKKKTVPINETTQPDVAGQVEQTEWVERRDGDYLVSRKGKILGRVTSGMGTTVYSAEAVYEGGGTHRTPLGDYISNRTARDAVEEHVRDIGLTDAT